jgi:hypothetical protein
MQFGVKSRTIWRESAICLLLGSPALPTGIWMWRDAGLILFLLLYVIFACIILIYWIVVDSLRVRVTSVRVERILFGRFVVKTYPVTQFERMAHDHIVVEGGRTLRLLGVELQDMNQIALILAARKEEALAAPGCVATPHTVRIDPAWLAWNEAVVVRLAQGFAKEQAFDRLAVLADALEEAGCADLALLDHLRSPGAHLPSS